MLQVASVGKKVQKAMARMTIEISLLIEKLHVAFIPIRNTKT